MIRGASTANTATDSVFLYPALFMNDLSGRRRDRKGILGSVENRVLFPKPTGMYSRRSPEYPSDPGAANTSAVSMNNAG